jgi:hypothetical protein
VQSPDLEKTHDIFFASEPPEQAEKALQVLSGIDKLKVSLRPDARAVTVTYQLLDYSLEGLESALTSQGFVLDSGLMHKARRAFVHYEEHVQLDNLGHPTLQEKKKKEIFTHVYDHHPHGDHDDTPEEWREYK